MLKALKLLSLLKPGAKAILRFTPAGCTLVYSNAERRDAGDGSGSAGMHNRTHAHGESMHMYTHAHALPTLGDPAHGRALHSGAARTLLYRSP